MKRYKDIPWEEVKCSDAPEDTVYRRYWEKNLRGRVFTSFNPLPCTHAQLPQWAAPGFTCRGDFFEITDKTCENPYFVCEHIIEDVPVS